MSVPVYEQYVSLHADRPLLLNWPRKKARTYTIVTGVSVCDPMLVLTSWVG